MNLRPSITLFTLLPLLSACAWVTDHEAADWADQDGDGVPWSEDCDDQDSNIQTGASWYVDADLDGFGADGEPTISCGQPQGHATSAGDCDDADDEVSPGMPEIPYDGIDNDCAGGDLTDADGDGADAKAAGGRDCDDDNPDVNPDATEGAYDGIDQDCDGEDLSDLDGDGYDGERAGGQDCDDDNPDVSPDADEVWYDGVDQDCEGDDDYDADGDGATSAEWGGDDCDDSDEDVSPGAAEVCSDGVDNDCDGLASCGIEGDLSATDADLVAVGERKNDQAAVSLATLGDVDADGVPDLIVGAPTSDRTASNAGAIYILSGDFPDSGSLGDAPALLTGMDAGGEAGRSVACAGDADGDGNPDLLVGAPKVDDGGTYAGAVYLLYSPVLGELPLSDADMYAVGDDAADYAGMSVAGVGDLDGDGQADFAVGAPGADANTGRTYLLFGPKSGDFLISFSNGEWLGDAAGDASGTAVTGPGDVDGDGYDDVLIGAPAQAAGGATRGAAYLLLGPADDDGSLEDSDAALLGEADKDAAGTMVRPAGDADGDGYADMLVGAPSQDSGATNGGAAYLVTGPVGGLFNLYNSLARVYGAAEGDQAGSGLTGDMDLDGDGSPDLALGVPYDDSSATNGGAAVVFYGPVTGAWSTLDGHARVFGESASSYVGYAVAAVSDVSGDGVDELVLGGYGYPTSETDTAVGAVWMFYGGGL